MKLEAHYHKTHRTAATLLSLWSAPPRCLAGQHLIPEEDVEVGGAGSLGGGGAEPGGSTNHRPARVQLNQHTLSEFSTHRGEGG